MHATLQQQHEQQNKVATAALNATENLKPEEGHAGGPDSHPRQHRSPPFFVGELFRHVNCHKGIKESDRLTPGRAFTPASPTNSPTNSFALEHDYPRGRTHRQRERKHTRSSHPRTSRHTDEHTHTHTNGVAQRRTTVRPGRNTNQTRTYVEPKLRRVCPYATVQWGGMRMT